MNSAIHYACMLCIFKAGYTKLLEHIKVAEVLLARPSISLNLKNLDNKIPFDLI